MQYQNQEYKRHNKISLFYFLPAINMKQNEIKTVKYSDKCLVLNERDNENFKRYYKKCADEYLPVYYMDNAKICKRIQINLLSCFLLEDISGRIFME